jgi:large subunit ribosomal protein L15
MKLSELRPKKGSTHSKKRVGRGPGSGHGKTSTRGVKGQRARSGGPKKEGFEGGQMPLQRRLPKFGFTNVFAREYAIVNVADLERVFKANAVVNEDTLLESGLIKKVLDGVKVLGNGKLEKSLTVHAKKFSTEAKKKIEAAGGKVEVVA